jgi:hypothetical protein
MVASCAANGNVPSFNTTMPVCVQVRGNIPDGWFCFNADGRSVTVTGASTAVVDGVGCMNQQLPVTAGADGFVYLNFSAGTFSYAGFACF